MAKGNQKRANGSALEFEAQLWAAADKMRGHMDASEYKHVVLGLIFLKYISEAFEEKREQLLFGFSDPKSEWFIKDEPERAAAAENRDEYLAARVFWLPKEARWHNLKAKAKSPEIGKLIDEAMIAIERENPSLKNTLPKDYARPSLDKVRLGGLVDIISNIGFGAPLPVASRHPLPSDGRGAGGEGYQDVPGFCKSVALDEIRNHDHVLTPGRYVGAAKVEDDGEPFAQKMKRLTATLEEQFAESAKLEKRIHENLKSLTLSQ